MNEIPMLLAGLVVLIAGAELLVRSSVIIATRLGIPSLVIGLTIVAFGTSAPEVVASVAAALRNSPGIAVGNIVGSNITNALLVAGATALLAPIAVSGAALRRDGFVALLGAVVFWLICALQGLSIATGIALLLGLAGYIVYSYLSEKRHGSILGGTSPAEAAPRASDHPLSLPFAVIGAIVGAVLLAFGGGLLIDAAVSLAERLGVSDVVIGLTIIAVGTSLPELATSMLAALRGKPEIAFGNIVGSNIFNVLGIGGLTAMLSQGGVPGRLIMVDFPIMVATTVLLLVVAMTGLRIGRREGAVLLTIFVLYVGAVWLEK
jgi:cation:H+ antiporter